MKIRKIEAAFVDERGEISDIFYKHQIDHVGIITSVTDALRDNAAYVYGKGEFEILLQEFG